MKTTELIEACKTSNILLELRDQEDNLDVYIFNAENTPFTDLKGKVAVQFMCPLIGYYWFYWVSWEDFISLAKGKYTVKSQEEYKILLKENDKPYKRNTFYVPSDPNVDLTPFM